MSRIDKSAETKNKFAVACGWAGRKEWDMSANVFRSSFGVTKGSKLYFGDDCTTL